jgi:hypothetical protein
MFFLCDEKVFLCFDYIMLLFAETLFAEVLNVIGRRNLSYVRVKWTPFFFDSLMDWEGDGFEKLSQFKICIPFNFRLIPSKFVAIKLHLMFRPKIVDPVCVFIQL